MKDILLENSLQNESNISTLTKALYADEIAKDISDLKASGLDESSLKESIANTSSNIASYKRLVTSLINRVKASSDLEYICSVLPTTTPEGKVYAFGNKLSGRKEVSPLANLRIIKLVDASVFSEDGFISTATASGTILHLEDDLLLVQVNSGTFAGTNDVDNVETYVASKTTIKSVFTASHALGTMFKEYTGQYSTLTAEELIDRKQIDFTTTEIDVLCKTRLGSTGSTLETIKDMIATHGIKYRPIILNMLEVVMKEVERQDIFTFLKTTATQQPNIVLTNSYGTQSSIPEIYVDIYNRINQSIGSIGTATGISGGKYSVIASTKAYRGLFTALKDAIVMIDNIAYLPGLIPLIEDGYSLSDYITVTLIGPENNSAVLFTPYDVSVAEVTDPDTFAKEIKVIDRYDIVDNPLATKPNGKNEMCEITYIDGFDSITNEI